jgi:hypothetical protein
MPSNSALRISYRNAVDAVEGREAGSIRVKAYSPKQQCPL